MRPDAPPGSTGPAIKRLTVLGDSIALQYAACLPSALPAGWRFIPAADPRADRQAGADLDTPQGANRGGSDRLLAFLRTASAGPWSPANWVLLNAGLHDIKRDPRTGAVQTGIDAYTAHLREIAQIFEGIDARPIWVRTTPCDDAIHRRHCRAFIRLAADVEAYNRAADAVMARAGVPIIDLFGFTRGLAPPAELFCDHVHFHPWVRGRQARYLAEQLGPIAACPPAPPPADQAEPLSQPLTPHGNPR